MKTFGIALRFKTPQGLATAARSLRERGFTRLEAFTPFPVDSVEETLHPEKSRLPLVALLAGALGAISGFYLQYYYMVLQYPHNVGGRPLFSWQAFVPVLFELTVLFSGVAILVFFFLIAKLPTLYHPLFNMPSFSRATDDRFFLCLEASDPLFEAPRTRALLESLGAEEVYDVPV